MNWITRLAVSVALVWAVAVPLGAHELESSGEAGEGGDFTLQSFDGPVSLNEMGGKVVLIFFGFTSCVDICPTTLAVLSNVFRRLSDDELDDVIALFISLDPERDSPEVLKKYTDYFHPKIVGVTENEKILRQVTANYGVDFERRETSDSALGYVIYHTPDILVVDRQGRLLETRIQFTASVDEITNDIKGLITSTR